MHDDVRIRLARFRRRVHAAAFAGGFTWALALLLLLFAAWLVSARILGLPSAAPRAAWSALLLLPVAWGIARAASLGLPPVSQAAHLDQRLGLGGLLLAAAETDGAAWHPTLAQRLAGAGDGLPSVRWGLLGRRLVLPAALFAGACLLPVAPPSPVARNPSIDQALEDLEAELELMQQQGVLPEEKLAELARRSEELRRATEQGKEASWSDVDDLDARLQQERALHTDALQKTAHAARAVQEAVRNAGAGSEPGSSPDFDARMRELLQHAAAAGLLGKLPPDVDPGQASRAGDAESIEALAEALAKAALEQVEAMPAGLEEMEDLAEMLRDLQGDGAGLAQGVGRGGVDRGPGHATLELNERFARETSSMRTEKLPPGRVLPQDWNVMQTRRIDPEVAPQRNTGAGADAATGSGEAAWRRRLSPTHREVVHEYFAGRTGDGEKR